MCECCFGSLSKDSSPSIWKGAFLLLKSFIPKQLGRKSRISRLDLTKKSKKKWLKKQGTTNGSTKFWGLPIIIQATGIYLFLIHNHPIHSRKLTWHPKIDTWKRRFLLETIILRFHVSFRESINFRPSEGTWIGKISGFPRFSRSSM